MLFEQIKISLVLTVFQPHKIDCFQPNQSHTRVSEIKISLLYQNFHGMLRVEARARLVSSAMEGCGQLQGVVREGNASSLPTTVSWHKLSSPERSLAGGHKGFQSTQETILGCHPVPIGQDCSSREMGKRREMYWASVEISVL